MMPVVAPAHLPVSTMGIDFQGMSFGERHLRASGSETRRALKVPCQCG